MDVFSNVGCYFGFMQSSAHKLKGTGALLQLANLKKKKKREKNPPIGTIRSNF